MPHVIRWFVKSSLVYFVLALVTGLFLPAQYTFDLPVTVPSLTPVFYHLLMVGWVTQMIFGVSLWMFPSHPSGERFGPLPLVWGVYGALNAGLLMRVVAEPLSGLTTARSLWDGVLVVSAGLQWVSALLYVVLIWPRVKGK